MSSFSMYHICYSLLLELAVVWLSMTNGCYKVLLDLNLANWVNVDSRWRRRCWVTQTPSVITTVTSHHIWATRQPLGSRWFVGFSTVLLVSLLDVIGAKISQSRSALFSVADRSGIVVGTGLRRVVVTSRVTLGGTDGSRESLRNGVLGYEWRFHQHCLAEGRCMIGLLRLQWKIVAIFVSSVWWHGKFRCGSHWALVLSWV